MFRFCVCRRRGETLTAFIVFTGDYVLCFEMFASILARICRRCNEEGCKKIGSEVHIADEKD